MASGCGWTSGRAATPSESLAKPEDTQEGSVDVNVGDLLFLAKFSTTPALLVNKQAAAEASGEGTVNSR